MRTTGALAAAICALLSAKGHDGFLHTISRVGGTGIQSSTLQRKLMLGSSSARPATSLRAEGEEVLLIFKPSGVKVPCETGEVILDVAERCSGMVEDSKNPFCRDGACYNCEVEIVEAADLGLEDNVVRACLFKVPEGVEELNLIQMASDEAFEDML